MEGANYRNMGVEPPRMPETEPPRMPETEPPKKNNNTIYIVLTVILVILLAIACFLFYRFQVMKKNYKEGVKTFETGNYAQAAGYFDKADRYNSGSKLSTICDIFASLKASNYEQAAKQAEKIEDYKVKDEEMQTSVDKIRKEYYDTAGTLVYTDDIQNGMYIYKSLLDYDNAHEAACYYDGILHLNDDDVANAEPLFDEAGDYSDAKTKTQNCKDYQEAAQLQEKGDDASLEEADKIFSALGDFQDSADRALACRSVKLYRDAKTKADGGDYEGAYKILSEYPNNPYPGWSDLLNESRNNVDYNKAEKYYKDEHFYKAYLLYSGLGDFKDSQKKKGKCVKDTPASKVLFQDDGYKSSSVEMTFKNGGSNNNYIKMYTSGDKLVARIFVRKNSSATIHLPAGTYHINQAYGTTWYGKKDMFGDPGYYVKSKVNGSYNFTLKSGYIYTLSHNAGGSGDAVSGDSVGADDF